MVQKNVYIFDGGLGTMLQSHGLAPGACPEEMNLIHPEAVYTVHKKYADAGAGYLSTNTFGGNRYKLEEYGFGDQVHAFNKAAAEIAKKATAGTAAKVAGSIGPTGYFLKPLGQMTFDQAYEVYKEQIEALVDGGVDLLLFETFNDLGELKAGIIAAKDVCDLPVVASLTYENSKTLTGVSPDAAAAVLEALGVYGIGANCSGGPKELLPVLQMYRETTDLALLVQPNAGMPELRDGEVYFPLDADSFLKEMEPYFSLGITFFGSCCGSNPAHTAEYHRVLTEKGWIGSGHEQARDGVSGAENAGDAEIAGASVNVGNAAELVRTAELVRPEDTVNAIDAGSAESRRVRRLLASKSILVEAGPDQLPKLIGERINPTARKKLAESLRQGDLSYLQDEAYLQTEQGAHLLDVNLGLPDIDQKELMREAVCLIQQSADTPLVIDSTDPVVIEEALKYYQGKALINSVNGESASMEAVLPLAARYGAAVIALTLDENGIPETKEGRLGIASKIVERAAFYGIKPRDIYVDCLALTVGTSDLAAKETLETVALVKELLGVGAVLGVSNVSHGLPVRSKLNAAFLAVAIYNGLDLAIINPEHEEMISSWEAAAVLAGRDPHAGHYLKRNAGMARSGIGVSVGRAQGQGAAAGGAERESGTTGLPAAAGLGSATAGGSSGNPGLAEQRVDLSPLDVADQVVRGSAQVVRTVAALLESGLPAIEIINKGIIVGLDAVGRKFEAGEFYLPQLMLSAEVSQKAFDYLESKLADGQKMETKGTVVIGTVKGDVHDIGKNMVGVMIKNHGYQVIDLGKNVSSDAFLAAVEQYRPDFVGLSALMTTTMTEIPLVISYVRQKYPQQMFLCGGAVVTQEYADASGADGYCRDAAHTIRVMEALKVQGGQDLG